MAAADGAAAPIANRLPSRRVTAVLLLATAALDLTRCGLVAATVRQVWEAALPMSAGFAAAAVSIWTARGCHRGARWSGWAAFLIGAASGPQASASGFGAAYTIPDGATALLGVLVAVGVLATAGRGSPVPTEQTRPNAAGHDPTDGEQRCLIVLADRSRPRTPT